jgi:hypothetical protein
VFVLKLHFKDIPLDGKIVRMVTVPPYILDDDLQTEIYLAILEENWKMPVYLVSTHNAIIAS